MKFGMNSGINYNGKPVKEPKTHQVPVPHIDTLHTDPTSEFKPIPHSSTDPTSEFKPVPHKLAAVEPFTTQQPFIGHSTKPSAAASKSNSTIIVIGLLAGFIISKYVV